MQSLGPSVDVLKAQGQLLESGFTGREDKPRDIVEAFRDYWDLVYAEVPVPEDGWPSPLTACLKACDREVKVVDKHQALTVKTVEEALKLPTLEAAFSWSSSSTLAGTDNDDASDTTDTSLDSNPFLTPTKVVEPPSTPKAPLLTCSPSRPSKTASVQRGLVFSPIIPTTLDFTTSSTSLSTPSRAPRSPLRSPKRISNGADKENSPPKPTALPATVLERIALASPGAAGTPQLGKRRASNTPADARSPKRSRAAPPEDDSEAEREEVQRSLLQPTTPDAAAAARRLQTALAVFGTAPRAPATALCGERSPSPTPQQPVRKRRRKGVFMDAVEVPQRRVRSSPSVLLPPPPSSLASSSEAVLLPSTPPPPPPPLLAQAPASLLPLGPSGRRSSLRRAKSLAGLAEQPLTPVQRKRHSFLLAKRRKTAGEACGAAGSVSSSNGSSPISASLKRARMLVGSDDSMAAEIEQDHTGALPPLESSDDDPHLGQVTPHHIVSPAPRRLTSRFFGVHGKY